MAYKPLWQVEIWAANDIEGSATVLAVLDGEVVQDMFEPVTSCDLRLPKAYDLVLDDYADFAGQLLQRGSRIRVKVAEDGDFSGSFVKTIADVFIDEVVRDPTADQEGLHQDIILHCSDEMSKARANGLNITRQTKILLLDIEFTSTDFSGDDTNFLVNIPTDSLTEGYEFVPQLIFGLYCSYDDGGEQIIHEYNKDEYSYGANSKIIYFHNSQAAMKSGSGTWHATLYYYDPDDTSNSVKNLLTAIATGDPHSDEGGLGIDGGNVDLEEITATDDNPKIIRDFSREKPDGPITQQLDDLREAGLLPYNYWLRINPANRKLTGEYYYQETDSSILVPAYGVFNFSASTTMEGVFGIVEVYSQAITPKNYALGASVTLNPPGGDYSIVLAGADGSEIVDGRPDTFCNFQYTAKVSPEREPTSTPVDCYEIDIGEVQPINQVMLRMAQGWWEDREEPLRLYKLHRQAKVTVSASLSPITDANPGIPVSDEAIAYECDYENPQEWITFQADNITRARYFAIRFEQDAFFRNSDPGPGVRQRTSVFGIAEIKILGDQRFRYDKIVIDGAAGDHPDKGRVPYAEVKGTADITTVAAVTDTTHFTLTNTSFADTGDIIQVKHGSNDPVMCRVVDKVGDEIEVAPEVPSVAGGDGVGEYNRWMLAFDGAYHDLYYPKLDQKLANTTEWAEIIDEDVAEIEDAEMSAVERILESIQVTSDHRMDIPFDYSIDVGNTVKAYADEDPWMVTKCRWGLNRVDDENQPAVTQRLEGSNYEATAQ